jgi:hypothetical protein
MEIPAARVRFVTGRRKGEFLDALAEFRLRIAIASGVTTEKRPEVVFQGLVGGLLLWMLAQVVPKTDVAPDFRVIELEQVNMVPVWLALPEVVPPAHAGFAAEFISQRRHGRDAGEALLMATQKPP